jgi:hypothetical protein
MWAASSGSVPGGIATEIRQLIAAPISSFMIIALPDLLEQAWARALPGRECAERNEVLRAFSHVRLRANRTLNRHRGMTESDPSATSARNFCCDAQRRSGATVW